jgi:transposase
VVQIPCAADREDRQLTVLRQRLSRRRTQIINRVCHILNKHNLHWDCPTKGNATKAAGRWLHDLELEALDRLELNHCLEGWDRCEGQIAECQQRIVERVQQSPSAQIVRTVPGASDYAALALASRIGDVRRFLTPRSLGNYWGLTPSCRDSGEKTGRRGSITKDGSPVARFILGQLVMHVLRRDPQIRCWYKRIRQRRGSKIARVAVMRRLTTILWHMLQNQTPYVVGGLPPGAARRDRNQATPPNSAGARGPHPACPKSPVGTSPADSGGCRTSAAAPAKPRRRKAPVQ